MFNWLEEIIDIAVHVFDFRHYWRIYFGVTVGFLLVFALSEFVPRERVSVAIVLLCIVIPAVLGGIWHGASNKH